MYDSILVPIDDSDPSDAALDHAQGLARGHDATVHVVHATDYPARESSIGRVPETAIAAAKEQGEALLDEGVERFDAIDTETSVIEGDAVSAITDYASEHDIDLIVMGTHGRTGVKRVLLGSTTERTLRLADRPVLVVESSP